MPLAVLLTVAGLHVPAMPLSDVAGNVGTASPLQIVNAVPKLKLGVRTGLTVTVNVCVVAHCPAVGVNVYVSLVELLIVAGLHVPVIPLLDVVGKVGAVAPAQILALVPNANVGVTTGLTAILMVTGFAQAEGSGVNV